MALQHVCRYRNTAIEDNHRVRNYGIIALSQVAYIAIIPFALVEAALTSIAHIFARVVLRMQDHRIEPLDRWARRSCSALLWSIHLAVRNLFDRRLLIATEADWVQGHLYRRPDQPQIIRPDPGAPFWTNQAENLLIHPPEVEPALAEQLKTYQLGDNAVKYTDVFERIYQDLPIPTWDEIDQFSVDIVALLQDRLDANFPQFNLMLDLEQVARENPRTPENDHFIKMIICSYKTIMQNDDASEIEIMKAAFIDANSACRTRRNDELLRLFMTLVAPRLDLPYLNAFTPTDSLIFDLMQHRIKLREQLLNIAHCNDTHDHNYFCRKLNENVFHLPFPNLSDEEFRFGNHKANEEQQVIRTFKACYDSPAALYDIFLGILYPREKEVFKYKPAMFVQWLNQNGLMNADAFADEEMEKYKPDLIIRYLVEIGVYKEKT
jgi:hypothetical protein